MEGKKALKERKHGRKAVNFEVVVVLMVLGGRR